MCIAWNNWLTTERRGFDKNSGQVAAPATPFGRKVATVRAFEQHSF
jgi:hypothetical protein